MVDHPIPGFITKSYCRQHTVAYSLLVYFKAPTNPVCRHQLPTPPTALNSSSASGARSSCRILCPQQCNRNMVSSSSEYFFVVYGILSVSFAHHAQAKHPNIDTAFQTILCNKHSKIAPRSTTRCWAEGDLPPGFNPFKAQQGPPRSERAPGPIFNLRKIRMSKITSDCLQQSSIDAMKGILLDEKKFLLEPLEDRDAVVDEDSIYTPDMSRDERYEAHRVSMQERVQKAKDPSARKVLTALMEFTASYK